MRKADCNFKLLTQMKMLGQIFMTFFKMSPVTFGGGYAMIPLIEREVVEKRGWMETKEITDVLAVSQSIPGAVAVNSAMFIGYRLAGVLGAISAMIGMMVPTFCIIVALSIFFLQIQENPKIEAALTAIRASIVALITYAAINIGKSAVKDKSTFVLAVGSVVGLYFLHIHPVLMILLGGAIGVGIIVVKKKLGMDLPFDKKEQTEYVYPDYYIGDGI